MADRVFVLNEPLCFILSKFGKTQLKLLKTCVIDFYNVDAIAEAKCQLLDDVGKLSLVNKLPYCPRRRDGDGRILREIDDIISILNILDEQKMLRNLPRYVSENPDNMPSIRLFEGDLKFLLSWLDKTDSKVECFGKQLDVILAQFQSVQSQLSAIVKVQSTMAQHAALHVDVHSAVGNSHAPNTLGNKNINISNIVAKQPWSSDTSTPLQRRSTISSSATDNDGHVTQDDTPFLDAGRKRKKKRRRVRSNGNQQQEPQVQSVQQMKAKPSYAAMTRNGKPLFVGKQIDSGLSSTANKLVAAKPLIPKIKKSVYCVDNVHNSVSVADLCAFIENLSVKVISCFETKPRRRRVESDVIDHKAFRLCIASEDNERLLDSAMWPEFVSVSEWFFKSSTQRTSINAIASTHEEDASHDSIHNGDMETTIILAKDGDE